MYFERIYEPSLAAASYLIGDQATGEALVVDPVRDATHYLDVAAAHRLRITHVTETHIHADFASGARELAERAGARLLLSAEGGADWQYEFAADAGATLLRDGDEFQVGRIRVRALHTPGHTPEHLTFLITNDERATQPLGAMTGDFLFVGDVGRPDLLEKAAGIAGTMESGARTLFRSLQRFAEFPDYLQIWPGHGAGSPCGKSLGAVPQSTLGYERIANWALQIDDEDAFVRAVLDGQPEAPPYFGLMKRINRDGPATLGDRAAPRQVPAETLVHALREGLVIDARSTERFAAGHVPRTVNVPFGAKFATWVASLLPFDRPVFVVAESGSDDRVAEAARALALVGVDDFGGWFDARVLDVWAARHGPLEKTPQTTVSELRARLERGEVAVVDVRNESEWEAGHLPGVTHVPLARLAEEVERVRALAHDRPIVVHCQGGSRSAIAASVLQANGMSQVANLAGGYAAWQKAGLPVERDDA
ncbi:beta-lactamase domain protein [Gemmatirosa kalamazoonensis]|uniref:Beta-lactamase domain protein n=1 Tax=Gemmatirosa kalamazoonensis TaxID=861299 RepID=W0RM91_9BACT|nr:MBL fold metallo-hydrolase [Gemmatirosa kalamazoonensis]AHG90558.1 beta-lactamase domain protein [Gemmatirosa kalamazoonensis]